MMINWVARVNPSHPYFENDSAPPFDPHHLCISPWLWFSHRCSAAARHAVAVVEVNEVEVLVQAS